MQTLTGRLALYPHDPRLAPRLRCRGLAVVTPDELAALEADAAATGGRLSRF